MSDQDQSPTESHTQQARQSATSASADYQAIVQRLAFAAINEQRRSRRWRIFFILLTFLYLTPIVVFTLDLQGLNFMEKASGTADKHTALVKVSGVIADGENAGASNVINGLRNAFKDEDTAGVIVEINSPGGSPVQSADIYSEIKRLREAHEDIPVHVVVTDIAASGGYYIAAAGDRVFVNKSSLVGSIGVRMDSFGLVDMIEKLGIERRLMTAGEHKGLLDPFLPEKEAEKQHLQHMLDQIHEHFITAVKAGRGDRLQESPELFSGLVWTGEEAIRLGLADDFGSTDQVARDVIKQEDVVDFTPREMLLDRLAQRVGTAVGKALSIDLFQQTRLY